MSAPRSKGRIKRKECLTMAKIKIMDLPKDQKISKEVLKQIMGGTVVDDMINRWNKSIDNALNQNDFDDFDELDMEKLLSK